MDTHLRVPCSMGHTPLFPGKTRARRNWLEKVKRDQDIITISHAIFDALEWRRHRGVVLACDIDPIVRHRINWMRDRGHYPDLNLAQAGFSIQDTVRTYCDTWGVSRLGAVDVDLTRTLDYELPILTEVVQTLASHKYKGKVLFTFRNGRDNHGQGGLESRLHTMCANLPRGMVCVGHETYRSDSYERHAERRIGSSMVIVEIQGKPTRGH